MSGGATMNEAAVLAAMKVLDFKNRKDASGLPISPFAALHDAVKGAAVLHGADELEQKLVIGRDAFIDAALTVFPATEADPDLHEKATTILSNIHACFVHHKTVMDDDDGDLVDPDHMILCWHVLAGKANPEAEDMGAIADLLFKFINETGDSVVSEEELIDVFTYSKVFVDTLADGGNDHLALWSQSDDEVKLAVEKYSIVGATSDAGDVGLDADEFREWYIKESSTFSGLSLEAKAVLARLAKEKSAAEAEAAGEEGGAAEGGADAATKVATGDAAKLEIKALSAAERKEVDRKKTELDAKRPAGVIAREKAEIAMQAAMKQKAEEHKKLMAVVKSTLEAPEQEVSSEGLAKPLSEMTTEELVVVEHVLNQKHVAHPGKVQEEMIEQMAAVFSMTPEKYQNLYDALVDSTHSKQASDEISLKTFLEVALRVLGLHASDLAKDVLTTIFTAYKEHEMVIYKSDILNDEESDEDVHVTALVVGFHLLTPHTGLEETVEMLFGIYDHSGDGQIDGGELAEMVETSMVFFNALMPRRLRQSADKIVSEGDRISQAILTTYDTDNDDGIDLVEFTRWYMATNGVPGAEDYIRLKNQALESTRLAEIAKTADALARSRAGVRPRTDYGVKGVRAEAKLRAKELFAMTAPRYIELLAALAPWRDLGATVEGVSTEVRKAFDPTLPMGFTIHDVGFLQTHCVGFLTPGGQADKLGVAVGDVIYSVRDVQLSDVRTANEIGPFIQRGIEDTLFAKTKLDLVFMRSEKRIEPAISEVDFVETCLKTLLSDSVPQKRSGAKVTLEYVYRSIAATEGGAHVHTDSLVCGMYTMVPANDAAGSWETAFNVFSNNTASIQHERLFEVLEHAHFFQNAMLIPEHRLSEEEIFEELEAEVTDMMAGDVDGDHQLSRQEFKDWYLAKKAEEAELANDLVAHRILRRVLKVMRRNEILVADIFERAARGGQIPTYRHMQKSLSQFGIELDGGDASLLFTMFDKDGGGDVDWDEFGLLKTPSKLGLGTMPDLPNQDRRPKPSASALNKKYAEAMTEGASREVEFQTASGVGLGFKLAANQDSEAKKNSLGLRSNVPVRVHGVVPGGQADRLGIQVDDIIVALNGVECKGHPISWVANQISTAKKANVTFRLTVRHPFTLRGALLAKRYGHRWRKKTMWSLAIKAIEIMLLNPAPTTVFRVRIPGQDARVSDFSLQFQLREMTRSFGHFSTKPIGRRFKRKWLLDGKRLELRAMDVTVRGFARRNDVRTGDRLIAIAGESIEDRGVTRYDVNKHLEALVASGKPFSISFRRTVQTWTELCSAKKLGRLWHVRTRNRILHRRHKRIMDRAEVIFRQHWSVVYNPHPVLGFRMHETKLKDDKFKRTKFPKSSRALEPHRPEGAAYTMTVSHVNPGSLPELMGVKSGDIIVGIGHHLVEGFGLAGCQRALRMVKARRVPFKVTFRRCRLGFAAVSMARVVGRRWRLRTREAHECGTAKPPYEERDDGDWDEDFSTSDDEAVVNEAADLTMWQNGRQLESAAKELSFPEKPAEEEDPFFGLGALEASRATAAGEQRVGSDVTAVLRYPTSMRVAADREAELPPPPPPPVKVAPAPDFVQRTFRAAYAHQAEHPRCLSFVDSESFEQVFDHSISADTWAKAGYVLVTSTNSFRKKRTGYVHPNSCHETTAMF